MIGKILALAGIGTGTFLVVDRFQNGNWIWERATANIRLQQAQMQAQVQYQVQQQIRAREAERQRKEKAESMQGRYAGQATWANPSSASYGLGHW